MLLYKLFYLNKLKYCLKSKFSKSIQLRIINGNLKFGKNVLLRSGVKIRIQNGGKVEVGDNSGFNYNCIVNCQKNITIGSNTIIGQNVKFYDHDHNYRTDSLIRDNGFITSPIIIGDNVWIGSDCIILRGVTIGSNSVIAAGTIVRKDVNCNTICYEKKEIINKLIKKEI